MRDAEAANIFNRTTTTLFTGAAGFFAAILVVGAMASIAPRAAKATPQFSQQTNRPCGQCHANPAGGGKLKPFGQRFKDNGYKLPKR